MTWLKQVPTPLRGGQWLVLVGVFLSVALAGCTTECVPGASSACACTTGAPGAQVCNPGGTFGMCVCDGAPTDAGGGTFDGGGTRDAGAFDGGFDAGMSADPDAGGDDSGTPIEITRVAPAVDTVYVRDTLMVQISVRSSDVDRVELFLDGMFLVELVPPYSYVWDTRTYEQRSYEIVATATRGSRTASAVPLTVIVDRTSPSVVRHVPLGGATNVWLHDPVEVEFSEEVLATTVSGSAVSLNAGGAAGLAATLELDPGGTVITAQLSAAPPLPATVTVRVGATITDLAGNPAVPEEWSFEAPVWPQVGATFEPGGREPDLESSADGRTLFVAYHVIEVPRRLHVHQWTGSEWLALGGSLTDDLERHRFALDSSGAPVIAWDVQDGTTPPGQSIIHFARWDGTTWTRDVDPVVTSYTTAFEFGLDSSDRPILAWLDAGVLRVASWTGTAWSQFGDGVSGVGAVRLDARRSVYDDGGWPVISFASGSAPYAGVRRWDGTDWRVVGGSDFTDTGVRQMLAGAGSDGRTAITIVSVSGTTVSLRRLRVDAAGVWATLGSDLGAGGGLLAIGDDDSPVTTRVRSGMGTFVERYEPAGFAQIGTPLTSVHDLELYEGRLPVVAAFSTTGTVVLRYNGF